MAQNDYFVIVYQVLKYLYECLKKGEKPEACYLTASAYNIPENYPMRRKTPCFSYGDIRRVHRIYASN